MDYALLCPEVNSGRMYTGPGAGPMLAAAAGWDAVAAQLEYTASGYSSQVAGLTGQAWSGPSSMAMAASAARHVAWLQTTAATAAQTAARAYAAVAAYEAAFAMTVPPWVIAQNRALLMLLISTNFFGQNFPAIAVCETHYMEMWAQDATAMTTYASASASARTLTPFHNPPRTTNQAGQADQARTVAQTTANATSSRTQSLAQLGSHAASQQLGTTLASSSDPTLGTGSYTVGVGSESTATIGQATGTTTVTLESGTAEAFTGSEGVPLTAGTPYVITGPYTTVVVNGGSSACIEVETGTVAVSEDGMVTITPCMGIVPGGSELGATPGLLGTAAPGLAGTSGIQPQLNVAAMMGAPVCTPARSGLLGVLDAMAGPDAAAEPVAEAAAAPALG